MSVISLNLTDRIIKLDVLEILPLSVYNSTDYLRCSHFVFIVLCKIQWLNEIQFKTQYDDQLIKTCILLLLL